MEIYPPSPIQGLLIIEPDVFKDDRGFFWETYHARKYQQAGIPQVFVQDNHSHSVKDVLRGLHYQLHYPQDKLIYVVRGEIFDVAVDIRKGSPTFGKWAGVTLSSENLRQFFIPAGFAHGFYVLSDEVDVIYKCTDFYKPDDEYGIRWDDGEIAIDWPGKSPLLSKKDAEYPLLSKQPDSCLPTLTHNKKEQL
ncbi:MAG: dTDP-4-dehydrorhamnose 3,5-epimerase [bacterium]